MWYFGSIHRNGHVLVCQPEKRPQIPRRLAAERICFHTPMGSSSKKSSRSLEALLLTLDLHVTSSKGCRSSRETYGKNKEKYLYKMIE